MFLAAGDIPEPRRPSLRSGEQDLSGRKKCQRPDSLIPEGKGANLLPGDHLPQPDGSGIAGGQGLAVGGKGDSSNGGAVTGQGAEQLTAGHFPEPNCAVSSRGSQQPAIGGEGYRYHLPPVPLKSRDLAAGRNRANPDPAIEAGPSHGLPIRRESHAAHLFRLLPAMQLAAGAYLPEAQRGREASGGYHLAIWGGGDIIAHPAESM